MGMAPTSKKGGDVPAPSPQNLNRPTSQVENAGRLDPDGTRVDNDVDVIANTLLDFDRVSHRHVIAGKQQSRTHYRFTERTEHGRDHGMIRHPDTDRTALRML